MVNWWIKKVLENNKGADELRAFIVTLASFCPAFTLLASWGLGQP